MTPGSRDAFKDSEVCRVTLHRRWAGKWRLCICDRPECLSGAECNAPPLSGAQAGEMPMNEQLLDSNFNGSVGEVLRTAQALRSAAEKGKAAEVLKLIAARANIEERDAVRVRVSCGVVFEKGPGV